MKATIFALGVCLLLAACSEPEGPEPVIPIQPGSRSYEWIMNTLDYPGTNGIMTRRSHNLPYG